MRYSSTRYISLFLCFYIALIISTTARAQSVIYVNHAATGTNDGTSWTDANIFLQDALQAAQSGDEVWVAGGIYRPDQGQSVISGDNTASFELSGGVKVYGGFNGTEVFRWDRDVQNAQTILSGDLLQNDNDNVALTEPTRFENSNTVVKIQDTIEPAVLDGLLISGGHAVNHPIIGFGGGMQVFSAAILKNLYITRNVAHLGGGIYLSGAIQTTSVASLSNITFENNVADLEGGAIYLATPELRGDSLNLYHNSSLRGQGGAVFNLGITSFSNSVFVGNRATNGGAVMSANNGITLLVNTTITDNVAITGAGVEINTDTGFGSLTLVNALITRNSANSGGGIYNLNGPLDVINSTIAHNTSLSDGGGIYLQLVNTAATFRNSIIWGNTGGGSANQLYRKNPQLDGTSVTLERVNTNDIIVVYCGYGNNIFSIPTDRGLPTASARQCEHLQSSSA